MAINDASVSAPETVLRNEVADYLKVDDAFELMGVGFETLDENPNAQSMQKTYVNQKTATNIIKGYQTEFPFTADMIKSEKAVMAVYQVGRNHLTGKDAMFEYVRVDLFNNASAASNEFPARKFIVSCEVSGNTGKGGDPLSVGGTLKCVGDPVQGTFNTKTKIFTPDE